MRRQCPLCPRRPGSRDELLGHVAHAHGLDGVLDALIRMGTPDATREEFTIRDAAGNGGEEYGWCPRPVAETVLSRRRTRYADAGPYTLVRRTWLGHDEDLPD